MKEMYRTLAIHVRRLYISNSALLNDDLFNALRQCDRIDALLINDFEALWHMEIEDKSRAFAAAFRAAAAVKCIAAAPNAEKNKIEAPSS